MNTDLLWEREINRQSAKNAEKNLDANDTNPAMRDEFA